MLRSCNEDASTTNCCDSSLCSLGEVLSLDNNGLVGESSLSEHLEETSLGNIDDGNLKSKKITKMDYYCYIIKIHNYS